MKHLKRFESKETNIDVEEVKDILTEIIDEYPELKIRYTGQQSYSFGVIEVFEILGFDRFFSSKFEDSQKSTPKFYQFCNEVNNLIVESCERVQISQRVQVKILGLYDIHKLVGTSDRISIGLIPKST